MSALGLVALGVGLAGCGQRGPLYLPTDPAAANRSTLPDLILPGGTKTTTTTPTAPAPAGTGTGSATPNGDGNAAERAR